MLRTIIEPANVGAAALDELKSWLGISRPNEDDLLINLLRASLGACEAFTGQAPLSQLVEERVPVCAGSNVLTSRPVVTNLAIVELVAADGTRSAVDPADFTLSPDSQGRARFVLQRDLEGQAVAVLLRVGIASVWEEVPAALRQGVIRLAAFAYRERDRTGAPPAQAEPPASIVALWRPWRTMRLA